MFFLQLKNELWKLFGKKRTYIGTGMFLLVQLMIALLIKYRGAPEIKRALARNDLPVDHYFTNLTIAGIALVPIGYLMVPLFAALVGGDLIAKEAEDGTLRMILSRPVTRVRLLLVKWCAGAIFSFALVVTLGLFGALIPWMFFHTGAMFVAEPAAGVLGVFEGAEAWERFAVIHLVMTIEAATILTLAFMFSCLNIKPAAATILAISFFFVCFILNSLPYLDAYRDWFLIRDLFLWNNFMKSPIPWWRVFESLSILLGYNLTFFIVGSSVFQTRDIKS